MSAPILVKVSIECESLETQTDFHFFSFGVLGAASLFEKLSDKIEAMDMSLMGYPVDSLSIVRYVGKLKPTYPFDKKWLSNYYAQPRWQSFSYMTTDEIVFKETQPHAS